MFDLYSYIPELPRQCTSGVHHHVYLTSLLLSSVMDGLHWYFYRKSDRSVSFGCESYRNGDCFELTRICWVLEYWNSTWFAFEEGSLFLLNFIVNSICFKI